MKAQSPREIKIQKKKQIILAMKFSQGAQSYILKLQVALPQISWIRACPRCPLATPLAKRFLMNALAIWHVGRHRALTRRTNREGILGSRALPFSAKERKCPLCSALSIQKGVSLTWKGVVPKVFRGLSLRHPIFLILRKIMS